jgi:hypothetical protein
MQRIPTSVIILQHVVTFCVITGGTMGVVFYSGINRFKVILCVCFINLLFGDVEANEFL